MKTSLIAICLVLSAQSAWASCGDRPATPKRLSHSINWRSEYKKYEAEFTWPGVVGERHWWDVAIQNREGKTLIKTQPGQGPTDLQGNGGVKFFVMDFGKEYCVSVKARTDSGTKGCVSLVPTDPVCVTAPPVGPPVGPLSTQGTR